MYILFIFYVKGGVAEAAGFALRRPMAPHFFRSWDSYLLKFLHVFGVSLSKAMLVLLFLCCRSEASRLFHRCTVSAIILFHLSLSVAGHTSRLFYSLYLSELSPYNIPPFIALRVKLFFI